MAAHSGAGCAACAAAAVDDDAATRGAECLCALVARARCRVLGARDAAALGAVIRPFDRRRERDAYIECADEDDARMIVYIECKLLLYLSLSGCRAGGGAR